MKMKVVIYARQSTSIQQSIPAQISELTNWVESHWDAEICAKFVDVGSGKNTSRSGFLQLKEYIASTKVEAILVWRYDRLSRNVKDLIQFLEYCADLNVKVHSISEPLQSETQSLALDKFQISMLGAFAEYQRKVTLENQHIGFQQKFAEGKILTSVPYGYQQENGKLTFRNNEAKIVKKVFSLYLDGLGYKRIANLLNSQGLLNRKEKLWTPSRIQLMLTTEFYCGHISSKYGTHNRHDKMLISEADFQKVQALRKSKQSGSQWVTRRYILQKKLRCPHCGCVLTPQHTLNKGNIYHYYSCSKYSAGGKVHCPGITLNATKIEEDVNKEISAFIQSDRVTTIFKEQISLKNDEIKEKYQAKMKAYKKQEDKILTYYERQEINDEQLYERLLSIRAQKESLSMDSLISPTLINITTQELPLDSNPTIEQFLLYQSIIDQIQIDKNKKIEAIYLTGLSYDIKKQVI